MAPKRVSNSPPPGAPAGCYFDEAAASRVVTFFTDYCVHVKGELAGTPFFPDRWQEERILRPLFGWKQQKGGPRLIRTCYVEVPRKNGKSTVAGGVGLYLTYGDNEPGAEVYSAAADKDQARIVFDLAKDMVLASPPLRKRGVVLRNSISTSTCNGVYKVISADAKTKHGYNAHGIIFDELHAQPNRELYDVLTTSTGARRQPIIFIITTSGWDRNSICWEVHDYAVRVLEGKIIDPTFLPVIYSAGEKEDWQDERVWKRVNPGYGTSLKPEYIKGAAQKAKESPAYQNTFRRLHLDQWTQQATRWIDMEVWRENGEPVEPEKLKGAECYGGLDLSSTTDMAALGLDFPLPDAQHAILMRYWLPGFELEKRERRDRVPYREWAKAGFLKLTEGNVIDYDVVRADINLLAKTFNLKELAIDRWNATQISTQLAGDGITVVPFGQGFASMSAPSKELMSILQSGRLRHGNHPILTWNAENVAVEMDAAENIKPTKSKSTGRIDGIVTLIMAIGRATVHDTSGSVYEHRGILTVGGE